MSPTARNVLSLLKNYYAGEGWKFSVTTHPDHDSLDVCVRYETGDERTLRVNNLYWMRPSDIVSELVNWVSEERYALDTPVGAICSVTCTPCVCGKGPCKRRGRQR